MATAPPGRFFPTDGWQATQQARHRLSSVLFATLILGSAAALLVAGSLLVFPAELADAPAKANALALIAAGLALVLLVAAFRLRRLVRAVHRDCAVLERTVEAMRRREAYEESEATLIARISDLIEVFTRTRDLEAILNEAVHALQSTLKADCLELQLHDESDRFSLSIVGGGESVDLGDEIRRDVIGRGKSRLINDLPTNGEVAGLAQQGYASLIVAPLGRGRRATDRSIGLVAALNKAGRDFTSQELRLLSHFARHAGLIIENAQLYKRAEHLAQHDGLTNLYNQRSFITTLDAEIAEATQAQAPVALIMADLDNFKPYNDTYGHPKGDVVLRQVARIFTANTRQRDIVARYGGDEFVIILPATGRVGAQRAAETIRAEVEQAHFEGEERSGKITITLGIAVFPDDAPSAEALIQHADEALYRGKRDGKNRVAWASPLPDADAPPPPHEEDV